MKRLFRLFITLLIFAEASKALIRRFDEPNEKCQLKLYAVEEYLVPNELIDKNIEYRFGKDKSLETIGENVFN